MSLTSYRAAPSRAKCRLKATGVFEAASKRDTTEGFLGLAVTYSPTP